MTNFLVNLYSRLQRSTNDQFFSEWKTNVAGEPTTNFLANDDQNFGEWKRPLANDDQNFSEWKRPLANERPMLPANDDQNFSEWWPKFWRMKATFGEWKRPLAMSYQNFGHWVTKILAMSYQNFGEWKRPLANDGQNFGNLWVGPIFPANDD